MSRLPRTQPQSTALAARMIDGFTKYPGTFPSGDVEKIRQSLENFCQAQKSFNDAASMYKQAGKKQKDAFEQLKHTIASQVKAAQVDTAAEPVKIGLIGFGARKKKSPVDLPAAPYMGRVKALADGVVSLRWKKNYKTAGGPTLSFNIQSRTMKDGKLTGWQLCGTSLDCRAVLTGQPQGRKTEYRVIAVNHSGQSEPSRCETIIL